MSARSAPGRRGSPWSPGLVSGTATLREGRPAGRRTAGPVHCVGEAGADPEGTPRSSLGVPVLFCTSSRQGNELFCKRMLTRGSCYPPPGVFDSLSPLILPLSLFLKFTLDPRKRRLLVFEDANRAALRPHLAKVRAPVLCPGRAEGLNKRRQHGLVVWPAP